MESTQIFQARGSRYEMNYDLGMLGRLALLKGDLPRAYAFLHEAVTLGRAIKYQNILAHWQPVLALVTLYEGDVTEARRLLEDSLRICLDLNDRFYLARVSAYLAETALSEGDLNEAEQWLAQSLAYDAVTRRDDIGQVESLLVAARLATAQGAYPRAASLFGLAEKVRSQIGFEPVGPVRLLADAALATARASLDAVRFDEAFTAGQQLSLEEAFATILAPSSVTGAPPLLSQLSV